MVQFSDAILDRYGGNQLSKLTVCGAKELPELHSFLDAAIWNHIFGAVHPNQSVVHLDMTLLRRALAARDEYGLALENLRGFVAARGVGNHVLHSYWSALHHFEQCIAAIGQAKRLAVEIEKAILGVPKARQYTEGDGSDLDRITTLYNRSRHFESDWVGQSSSPLWISNSGLSSPNANVSFEEIRLNIIALFDMLRDTFVEIPAKAAARKKAKG